MGRVTGRVISLDRGYPLVRVAEGEVRAQHSIDLVKNFDLRAAVGDVVELDLPQGQDTPLIAAIHPRGHTLRRRSLVESIHDGAGKYNEQVLAANIDIIFVVTALSNRRLDVAYLERQLVMAHESGAEVAVVLTKADQARHLEEDVTSARKIAFDDAIIIESAVTGSGLDEIVAAIGPQRTGVLLGRSGVGKSTLINELLGAPLLQTGSVRKKDRAGRHTTVARKLVFLDGEGVSQGALIDTPGLRSIGLYGASDGLAAAFPDVVELAAECRYRNCMHTTEPGCAVNAAVEFGTLPAPRLASYTVLAAEVND